MFFILLKLCQFKTKMDMKLLKLNVEKNIAHINKLKKTIIFCQNLMHLLLVDFVLLSTLLLNNNLQTLS